MSERGKRWDKVRRQVYRRDKWTCQNCRRTECVVVAHHLEFWENAPRLRFVLSNLVTLCERCHDGYHRGKHGLTVNGRRLPKVNEGHGPKALADIRRERRAAPATARNEAWRIEGIEMRKAATEEARAAEMKRNATVGRAQESVARFRAKRAEKKAAERAGGTASDVPS